MARLANFLQKPRNFAIVALASAGVTFSYKAVPHFFPDNFYRPIFEAYKAGKRYEVTADQQQEFQQACSDLGIDSSKYRTFVTSRWEVKKVGLPWLPAGCHIGIPASMVQEPELTNFKFSGPIKANLDTREGTWLKDSLKLSPAARRFAVAQQVALSDTNLSFYPIVLAPVSTLAAFATTFIVHGLAPIAPVFVTGLGISTCFYFAYSFVMGSVNEKTDLRTNQRLAAINDEYTMGGLEFYEKLLQKNRALRTLLGKRGERLYTYYGNETPGLVYSTGATNIQKRDILKEMVEAAEKKRKAKEKLDDASHDTVIYKSLIDS